VDDKPRITPPVDGIYFGTELDQAIARFAVEALRSPTLDPVVAEAIRLRCAQYHDCRLCGSLRAADAVSLGLDETLVAKISKHQSTDLPDVVKVALALVDAIIVGPAEIDESLPARVRKQFTEPEIVEILLNVAKWSQQKILVALRLDGAKWDTLRTFTVNNGDISVGPKLLVQSQLGPR